MFNIANRLADKILDLERVADVQDIDLLDSLDRRDIYSNRIMVPGNEFKQGLSHLSESNDNNLILLSHGFEPPSGKVKVSRLATAVTFSGSQRSVNGTDGV